MPVCAQTIKEYITGRLDAAPKDDLEVVLRSIGESIHELTDGMVRLVTRPVRPAGGPMTAVSIRSADGLAEMELFRCAFDGERYTLDWGDIQRTWDSPEGLKTWWDDQVSASDRYMVRMLREFYRAYASPPLSENVVAVWLEDADRDVLHRTGNVVSLSWEAPADSSGVGWALKLERATKPERTVGLLGLDLVGSVLTIQMEGKEPTYVTTERELREWWASEIGRSRSYVMDRIMEALASSSRQVVRAD